MFNRLLIYIYRNTVFKIKRIVKVKHYKKMIVNNNFSIISSNCIGGLISKDLGLKYNSPTVGLFIHSPCFIKLCENLPEYLGGELKFTSKSIYCNERVDYPIGILDDIEIHFLHYANESEALRKWNDRVSRLNYNNLYIIMTERDCFTDEIAKRFDDLDFEEKVLFGAKARDNLKSNINCKSKEDELSVNFAGLRIYEKHLDIIKWLNSKVL